MAEGLRVLMRKYIRQEQEEELKGFVLPATGYSNVDMNGRTGKEGKQRGMEGEQGKEGLFGEWKDGNYGACRMGAEGKTAPRRIVYGRKGGRHVSVGRRGR